MKYNFSANVTNYNYNTVIKHTMGVVFLVSLGVFVLLCLMSGFWVALVFSLALLVIQGIGTVNDAKYILLTINIENNQVKVTYKQEGEDKQLQGPVTDFDMKKKMAFSRSRSPYLAIYYKNKLVVKQVVDMGFNVKETDFDEAIQALQATKNSTTV